EVLLQPRLFDASERQYRSGNSPTPRTRARKARAGNLTRPQDARQWVAWDTNLTARYPRGHSVTPVGRARRTALSSSADRPVRNVARLCLTAQWEGVGMGGVGVRRRARRRGLGRASALEEQVRRRRMQRWRKHASQVQPVSHRSLRITTPTLR